MKARAALDVRLKELKAKRMVFDEEYAKLESATAATWDSAKERLDKQWEELKALADKANDTKD